MKLDKDLAEKLRRFKLDKRAYFSFLFLLVAFAVTLPAELLCNIKPILLVVDGKPYFPIFIQYSEKDFGGALPSEPDYKSEEFVRLLKGQDKYPGKANPSATVSEKKQKVFSLTPEDFEENGGRPFTLDPRDFDEEDFRPEGDASFSIGMEDSGTRRPGKAARILGALAPGPIRLQIHTHAEPDRRGRPGRSLHDLFSKPGERR